MSRNPNTPRRARASRQDIAAAVQVERAAQDIVGRMGTCCPACGHQFNPTEELTAPPAGELQARAEQFTGTAAKLGAALKPHLDPLTFELWIQPLAVTGAAGSHLTLAGPGHLVRWARTRCANMLGAVATELAGRRMTIEWIETPAEITHTIGHAMTTVGPPATMRRDHRAS